MTRFVIYGAGAIGGTVGADLFEAGFSVNLIARGADYDAIKSKGLTFESASGTRLLPIPVANHPSEVDFGPADVVLLGVKSQDTEGALTELAKVAPTTTPIVCMQNGVANEPRALRFFENVYGMLVRVRGADLDPGIVMAFDPPDHGIYDLGRFPTGIDAQAESIAASFQRAGYSSFARENIMDWKYTKFLQNLQNACEVVFGKRERGSDVAKHVRSEGIAALEAAGISWTSNEEMAERRALAVTSDTDGEPPKGSSSWQSVARSASSIESDYLNGEVVLLGRLHAVATPVNALLQQLCREIIGGHVAPASFTEEQFLALLPTK